MIQKAFTKVFSKPAYATLAICVSVGVLVIALWLPNLKLIASVIASPNVPLASKIELPLSLLGSLSTNFTPFSASYTIALSVLFGMYVAMMTYFLRRRIRETKQSGVVTGVFGTISGILGVGCAACGSLAFGTIFSLIGASGVVALLPLGGGEFGIIGVGLLMIALYTTAKQIETPAVCKI